ncbi:mechanosensitive ion channel family protein [Hamadaea tsunoensis]|uniref:mechanosensitive ion channel family protein n=1 Tax=Hamadaea tsunoensis TaxID=53368 RepID=UPI0004273723|nr:mechanosensitive ion channel domain-containing protein [Hamadaea tsunoensis]
MIAALLPLANFLADATPAPAPSRTNVCDNDAVCEWLQKTTGSAGVAQSSLWVIKPARILLIIVLALIARALINRTITRLTDRAGEGKVPTLLRPLRERLPNGLTEATSLFPERRRQRAAAIGSVLRSFATVVIFSVAGLMVLGELGIDLTPLVAGLGIVGAALGFGAQSLVKDLIGGLFMLLEDQYGVGDVVDVGDVTGVVEAVGLRTITIRDMKGVVWYVRNGEILRVGNHSQGNSVAVIDIPIGFAPVDEAVAVLRQAADELGADPEYADDFLDLPKVAGVENVTIDGVVVRVTAKTTSDANVRVARELRRRLTEALFRSGLAVSVQNLRAVRAAQGLDATGELGAE